MLERYTTIKDINQNERLVILLGNFDGMHSGHQYLVNKLKTAAKTYQAKSCIITFNPHPYFVFKPQANNFLLATESKRYQLFDNMVDIIVEIPFSRDFSTLQSKQFLEQYIFCFENIKKILIGYDFKFGANKSGDFAQIKEFADARQVETEQFDCLVHDGKPISSSRVRASIHEGDIKSANLMLGRNFSIEGRVIKGDGRGRLIGFPTANILYDAKLAVPMNGVYVTRIIWRGLTFQSITNVGVNPTFKDSLKINIETHIFNFNNEIYGEEIEVFFIKRLRSEQKFENVNKLIDQIKRDCLRAQEEHKSYA